MVSLVGILESEYLCDWSIWIVMVFADFNKGTHIQQNNSEVSDVFDYNHRPIWIKFLLCLFAQHEYNSLVNFMIANHN